MALEELSTPNLPDWLAPAMAFERRAVRIDGHRVHTMDHGDGPTVLLVHGNPTWSFLWRKVVRALPEARCVVPDLVGLGLSDRPSRRWHTVEHHVDIISRLVDELAAGPVVVAGQDWGGPIAAGVARHLDGQGRLKGLLLANTGVLPARRPARATAFHRFAHFPVLSELAFLGLGFPLQTLASVQGNASSMGKFERRAYRWPLRRIRDRGAPLALARMVPHRDDHPSLPMLDTIGHWASSFRGPAALVWGLRDPLLGRALKRIREAWPQASVTETQAGHFLQEEVPGELAAAIRGLL